MSAAVSLPISYDLPVRASCCSRMNLSLVPNGHTQLMATPPLVRSKYGRGDVMSSSGHCGSLSPARTQSPARKETFTQGLSVCTALTTEKLFCAQCNISRSSSNNSLSSNSELVITASSSTSTSTRHEGQGDASLRAIASALSADPFVSMSTCMGKKEGKGEISGAIAESMSPHQLAARLEGKGESKGVLLVDCRSFIAFNMNHVRDSVNLCCANRVVRKRLQSGKVQLADLVSGDEAKDSFRDKMNMSYDIVVYDENTTDPNQIQPNTSLHAIFTVLKNHRNEAYFLQGKILSCYLYYLIEFYSKSNGESAVDCRQSTSIYMLCVGFGVYLTYQVTF